jgi:hypothetical protein
MKNKIMSPWFIPVIVISLVLTGSKVINNRTSELESSTTSAAAINGSTSLATPSNGTAGAMVSKPASIVDPVLTNPIQPAITLQASENVGLSSLTLPIRAAFYYPWFPEAWTQQSVYPYTNYHPTLGYYDLSDLNIIQQQISAMLYGHIQAGIASWWGQGSSTDNRMHLILAAAASTTFKWSVYYEPEGTNNPAVNTITADLTYLRDQYSNDPAYLRINGRFVVFVYADANDGCDMAGRWKQANTVNAYIVLKVFPGYQNCASQPDGWHQYAPANAADSQGQYSYTISPGFWKVGENPRLVRNLSTWRQNIRDMIASGADFQLITTFNEWGEGTAVESAEEWASPSGYGAYLDALHENGSNHRFLLPIIRKATSIPMDPAVIR